MTQTPSSPQPIAWALLSPHSEGYRLINASKSFMAYLGMEVIQVAGKDLWELLKDDAYAPLRTQLRNVLAHPDQSSQTFLNWPKFSAHFELTPCATPQGIYLILKDISSNFGQDQIQQGRQIILQNWARHWSALVLILDIPGLIVSSVEHLPGEFLWLQPSTMVGQSLFTLFGDVIGNKAQGLLEQSQASGDVIEPQTVTIDHANHKLFSLLSVFVISSERAIMILAKSPADLMEMQQLKASKELAETLNRSKSFFLANIGHDLRTPLNAILGFAELMAEPGDAVKDPEKVIEYAGFIHESGANLLKIINDVIDLSRIETGRYDMRDGPVDLNSQIRTVQKQHEQQLTKKKIELELLLAAIPILRADVRAIKQILTNLLSNAVKFSPIGSKVTVQTEIDEGFCINLVVRDRGAGMNAQQIRRALIPYAQFDTSLHRKQGGTGLGLPLIRALVDLHHAKLKIKSDPNTGTEFRIIFPAERNIVAAQ